MPKPNDIYHVLARKWRPQQFDEVVGQEHITRTLKNAVSSGRIHHALLFIGSRGIGKTTTARILAKALNCQSSDKPIPEPCDKCDNCIEIGRGTHLDVQEIDGASNNSVDNIREIREAVRLAPAHARYKVYIIDEVHQLSSAAFNALLKTLEEPPSHAIFILATTEAHKIPATIISRCQRYDFRRVAVPDIVNLLEHITKAEKRKATKEALYAIARSADGGVRDAESILDQLMTYCEGEITYKDVQDILGLIEAEKIDQLVQSLLEKDILKILNIIDEISNSGKDLAQFVEEFIRHIRNLLILKTTQDPNQLFLPEEDIQRLKEQSERFSIIQLIRFVEQLANLNQTFTSQLSHRTALEAFFVKNCKVGSDLSIESILEKLIQIEDSLKYPYTPRSVQEKPTQDYKITKASEKKTLDKPVITESIPKTADSEKLNPPPKIPKTKAETNIDHQTQAETKAEKVSATEEITPKVLFEIAKESSDLRFGLGKIHITYHKATKTTTIYVDPSDTSAISILNKESTQQMIMKIMNNLRYSTNEIQVVQQSSKITTQKTSSQRKTHFKDLVSPELAHELRKKPQINDLLEHFQGRIVKVTEEKTETEQDTTTFVKKHIEDETFEEEPD
ncbi:MAG TPA: DNA polymerase III subunit gamma/tau [Candidatus Hydrogenedens sp.]|nr:DNA polymerase III subunit gamma/tau [Candidatus Hydrogenedens sp.]HOL19415.1 DNA polymerase III subunit gamma/tau [Candidatus Hydrogenedens sp.]HPP58244.1 DNA polymerase III subunit gamma/tau [Candidatus Hydrogenedens sp.]